MHTGSKQLFLLLASAALALSQDRAGSHDNYYSLNREAQVGERFTKQLQTSITATPEARVEAIGARLAAHSPGFSYRFLVFDGGQPSQDTAPAAAFPADWRRLDLDEPIAVAGGTILVPRRLLSRDEAQLTAILAHAMGHVALRHPTVGMTRGELAQVEVQVASRSVPEEAPQKVRAVALKRFAFDRACETAADTYAARLLHDSGIDAGSLLAYLRTLPAAQNNDMSVYPNPAERIEAVQKTLSGLR